MAQLDPRIVRLGISSGGSITWYEGYKITAKGAKASSIITSNCEITITGISSDARNEILEKTKPGTALGKAVSVVLEVGRESYGASVYYQGDVFRSAPMPKPDIGVQLKCLVGINNSRKIVSRGGLSPLTSLKQVATFVAADNGYKLSFQIPDRQIKTYTFTGSAEKSIRELQALVGDADVYVDNETLFIKMREMPAIGTSVYSVSNEEANLIECQKTEFGVVVKMLFHPSVTIGSVIDLESELNPSINGQYTVFKLNFDIAKRETQFYLNVEGVSL